MTNVIQITQLPAVASAAANAAIEAVQAGVSVQIALAQIIALIPVTQVPTAGLPCRVVLSNATSTLLPTDTGLLINKTIAGPTSVSLPTPVFQKLVFVKDMKGDAGTNNITLDAGGGNLINGQQTLVMNGNWGTTMLIGMSGTQWGTLI